MNRARHERAVSDHAQWDAADDTVAGLRRYAAHLAGRRGQEIKDRVCAALVHASSATAPVPGRAPHWFPWRWAAAAAVVALIGGLLVLRPGPDHVGALAPAVAWIRDGLPHGPGRFADSLLVAQGLVFAFDHAIDGDRVYLTAFERETGATRWRSTVQATGFLSADDRHLYLLEHFPGRRLVAIRIADGIEQWSYVRESRPFPATPPAVLTAADVVIFSEANNLYAVDRHAGQFRWTWSRPDDPPRSMATGAGGLLFVASATTLSALDPDRGSLVWTTRHAAQPGGALWLDTAGDHVVLASVHGAAGGRLRAFDAGSGAVSWTRDTGWPASMTIHHDRIFLRAGHVHVYTVTAGLPLWTADIPGCSPAVEADGVVYLLGGRNVGSLFALDAEHGTLLWSSSATGGSCHGLVTDGGWGFFRNHQGNLHALRFNQSG